MRYWLEVDRYHTVQEFNKGVYDYIIATDRGEMDEVEVVDVGEDCESHSYI